MQEEEDKQRSRQRKKRQLKGPQKEAKSRGERAAEGGCV